MIKPVITENTVLRETLETRRRYFHDEIFLCSYAEGFAEQKILRLNQIATKLLEHCDGRRTLGEVCDAVESIVRIPAYQLIDLAQTLFEQLLAEGFAEIAPERDS